MSLEAQIQKLLASGLHLRRGLSEEKYREACRNAWNTCVPTKPGTDRHLIDPLDADTADRACADQDYVDWRTPEVLASERARAAQGKDIYCVALGIARLDGTLDAGGAERQQQGNQESPFPELRMYLLAVFDILGFERLLSREGERAIQERYAKLIDLAIAREAPRCTGFVRRISGKYVAAMYGLPVKDVHFSDTFVLWVPLMQHFIGPFLARCADLVIHGLKLGLPLRGGISAGKAYMHPRSNTFLGAPLVEAARVEQAQDWVGVSLGMSMLAQRIQGEIDPNLVLQYEPPFKSRRKHLSSGLVLDWGRRCSDHQKASPTDLLNALDTSPEHARYYAHAREFLKASAARRFRAGHAVHMTPDQIVENTLQARKGGAPVSAELARLTFHMKEAGGVDADVAAFLDAVSSGSPAPAIPTGLPRELRRFLKRIAEAAGARSVEFIELGDLFVAVGEAVVDGRPLDVEHQKTLMSLRSSGREGAQIAAVVDQLLAGDVRARVPLSIPLEARRRLLSLRSLGRRKPPPDLLNTIAEAVVQAKCRGTPLSRHEERLLTLLAGCRPPWPAVATFLATFSQGTILPEIPDGLPPRILQWTLRLVHCTRETHVPTLWLEELLCLDSDIGSTGLSLWRLLGQIVQVRAHQVEASTLEPAILDQLERIRFQGGPHELASEYLLSLLRDASRPEVPKDVPVPIRLFLHQAAAVVNDGTTPLDASIIAQAALRTRFTGCALGDYLRFSLEAMSSAGGEKQRFAEYLAQIASRREPWPLPEFETTAIAQLAGHVRTLCDPGIGEPRLLVANQDSSHPSASMHDG